MNRLWKHTVGIVNGIRTVGDDPLTGKRGDTEQPGSGSVGQWGNHHFILTAGHVVEGAKPSDIRVFASSASAIEYRSPTDLRRQDIVAAAPLTNQSATIHRCGWEDLAAITIDPELLPTAVFFDALNNWIDPPEGQWVHSLGFPFDNGVLTEQKMVRGNEERTIVLQGTFISANVLPLPSENDLKYKITAFDSDRHYLIPYAEAANGKHPRGFSGAGAWWEDEQKEVIWTPAFKFAGTITVCYKNGSVLQVIKASVVRRFLGEIFGSAT